MSQQPPAGGGASRRFPRSARLKRRRLIRPLFERGRPDVGSVAVGSIRLLYRLADPAEVGQSVPVQAGFVAGRSVGKAAVRNRVKRILREVYRGHQQILTALFLHRDSVLTVMVLYRGPARDAPACVPHDLPEAMRQLARRLQEPAS